MWLSIGQLHLLVAGQRRIELGHVAADTWAGAVGARGTGGRECGVLVGRGAGGGGRGEQRRRRSVRVCLCVRLLLLLHHGESDLAEN